jgi:hypothetical protein
MGLALANLALFGGAFFLATTASRYSRRSKNIDPQR